HEHRKVVNFVVLVRRADRVQAFNLTKKKAHHVEHVNRRLIQEPARYFWIASPLRLEQLATIHLYVRGVWLMRFGEHLFQPDVDRRETAIVPDLKNCSFIACFPKY